MLPVRLVGGEDLADRLVAAPVAAEALERGRDRLLALRRAEALGELEAEVGGALADVALGHAQQQDVLRAERAHRERRADAGVDAAGDAEHGAAPAELAHGVADAGGEGVGRGLEIEGERVCRGGCGHASHPTRDPRHGHPAPGQEARPIDLSVRTGCRQAVGCRSRRGGVEAPADGTPPQDRDGAASARPELSPCPQAGCPGTPRARARAAARAAPVPRPRRSRAVRAGRLLGARRVGRGRRRQPRRRAAQRPRADGRPRRGRSRRSCSPRSARACSCAPTPAGCGPFRVGARRCSRSACSRCSARRASTITSLRHGGGYAGNGLHAAVAAVAGEPGAARARRLRAASRACCCSPAPRRTSCSATARAPRGARRRASCASRRPCAACRCPPTSRPPCARGAQATPAPRRRRSTSSSSFPDVFERGARAGGRRSSRRCR